VEADATEEEEEEGGRDDAFLKSARQSMAAVLRVQRKG